MYLIVPASPKRNCQVIETLLSITKTRIATMTALTDFAAPVGRVFLALIFITAGYSKAGDIAGTAAYIENGGLPGFLVYPTVALELIGGILIAVGFLARPTAFLLAGFCLLSGFLYHYLPAQSLEGFARWGEMNNFMKNVAIAGGFLMIVAHGAGAWSVDNARKPVPARA